MKQEQSLLNYQCENELKEAEQELLEILRSKKIGEFKSYGIYLMRELVNKVGGLSDVAELSPEFLQNGTSDITTDKIKEWSEYDSILVIGVNKVKAGDSDEQ